MDRLLVVIALGTAHRELPGRHQHHRRAIFAGERGGGCGNGAGLRRGGSRWPARAASRPAWLVTGGPLPGAGSGWARGPASCVTARPGPRAPPPTPARAPRETPVVAPACAHPSPGSAPHPTAARPSMQGRLAGYRIDRRTKARVNVAHTRARTEGRSGASIDSKEASYDWSAVILYSRSEISPRTLEGAGSRKRGLVEAPGVEPGSEDRSAQRIYMCSRSFSFRSHPRPSAGLDWPLAQCCLVLSR